jgi:hypothetical protein
MQAQQVEISTIDIDHFWEAYDQLANSKDSVSTMQNLYLNRATEGTKAFIKSRKFKAADYVYLIRKYPKFWASMRTNTLAIASRKEEINKTFNSFIKLYSEFKQPKVCFSIGALRSGGTTTKNQVLIGADIASSDSLTDKSELKGWLAAVIGNSGNIVTMVTHEAVHTQQPINFGYVKGFLGHRLLTQSIREGSADFIGMQVAGKIINNKQYKYGVENEAELWLEFKKEMMNNDISKWLYNGSKSTNRPFDLGYFIGYRICETYFNNSTDKSAAIKKIIRIKNYKKFLKKSGYNPASNKPI